MRFLLLSALAALVLMLDGGTVAQSPGGDTAAARTEVVVTLTSPPLAHAPRTSARIAAEQRSFRAALGEHVPDAEVRWTYRLVQNGFAVSLPVARVPQLRALPGVRSVYASAQYGPGLDSSPGDIGAPGIWGTHLETAGEGVKIGIIDSGIDQRHAFFDPTGYAMPPGFPKGQKNLTTAKVIVARSFPPPGATGSARLAYAKGDAGHGTHVAGIAAGNASTHASGGRIVSGVAPKAYLGNYKVFVPTPSGFSPNANSPEIVAAIEAAVADGMDVINFSGGENEIEPSRDIVARALDAAAAAGVVPVVAAGNEYGDGGAGSVSSPGNSASAITVGAVEMVGTPATPVHAEFSSVGPTPISLRLKPDVVAPGVDVVSSVPGGWSSLSGTSMASPHVAGAAALLRERHPEWTVADIKAALVETGKDVPSDSAAGARATPSFVGGGLVSLPAADRPLVFADPSDVSFGLREVGSAPLTGRILLSDAGGGAGAWDASLDLLQVPPGASLTLASASVIVPGELDYQLAVTSGATQGDISGNLVLRLGTDVRRIPFWGRITAPALGRHRALALSATGVHRGTTRGQPSLVTRYRYPENPRGLGVATVLAGPERVYRLRITKRVANFGVVITSRSHGTLVEPRTVAGLDENRLTGFAALPVILNPYLPAYGERVLAAGALSPRVGEYGIVFDSVTRAGAGRFTFRLWVNDVTPPTAKLRSRTVRRGDDLRVAVADAGSGLYLPSLEVRIDGQRVSGLSFEHGTMHIPTQSLRAGTHRLRLQISDFQETRNTENVAKILPNTRFFSAVVRVRPR